MAKSKTGSFYLTERVSLDAASANGHRAQDTIDLGAYVNVPTGQAIAVESIDFIVQRGSDHDMDVQGMLAGNGTIGFQLTDQNPGTVFIPADDHSLLASGCVNIDVANNIASHSNDFFPDEWGPANLSEAFMVVNDTLYLVAGNDGAAIGASSVRISARIRCRVVTLSKLDWMSIAIQSTAES